MTKASIQVVVLGFSGSVYAEPDKPLAVKHAANENDFLARRINYPAASGGEYNPKGFNAFSLNRLQKIILGISTKCLRQFFSDALILEKNSILGQPPSNTM